MTPALVCDLRSTNENGNGQGGQSLAQARKRVGLTQARLSALANCSIASIAWIEQGAVPQHSDVLARAWKVIEAANESDPAATPGPTKTADAGGRHGTA
jgi:DNA-binding XRE family transcriptional regulator